MTRTIRVDGMNCEHCAAKVKGSLEALDGVQTADVSLDTNSAQVTLSGSVSDDVFAGAIEEAGYQFVSAV